MRPRRSSVWRWLEVIAVLASPGASYAVLRLRGMAPLVFPDPSMHTTFVVDPRDIFTRYAAVFASTARMREAARVGFLVPARAAYLAFGTIGGFFTFRYVLALVAVVPLYVLLKRLCASWAGFLGIAVVMSSPVFVTAWGTDYPDSAAISYLTGGLCALAMPCAARRRPWWLGLAAGLFTLAVWSHGASVPLVVAALVAYAIVRGLRDRAHLVRDAAVGLGAAVVVTGLLALGSRFLLGQLNFLTPTWQAEQYLSTPAQEALWHSSNWRWVLYDPYLLVPPAVLFSYLLVCARPWRRIGTPQLFVGLAAILAFGAAAYLQFVGKVQMLEVHYFSSLLWSFVAVLVATTLTEFAKPWVGTVTATPADHADDRNAGVWQRSAATARQVLPVVLVVAVALAYETDAHVPAMKLDDWGWIVAGIVVGVALVWRVSTGRVSHAGHRKWQQRPLGVATGLAALVLFAGACLILTVAPLVTHPPLPNTGATADPAPAYATALGGSGTLLVDQYEVTAEVPGFVGPAAYAGEQLLTWWPLGQTGELTGPIGLFHSGFNLVGLTFPELDAVGKAKIEQRRPAQVLLFNVSGRGFAEAVRSLSPFKPVVVRRAVLSDGACHLHLWLVDLRRYLRRLPT